jgi:hypothetical protein
MQVASAKRSATMRISAQIVTSARCARLNWRLACGPADEALPLVAEELAMA